MESDRILVLDRSSFWFEHYGYDLPDDFEIINDALFSQPASNMYVFWSRVLVSPVPVMLGSIPQNDEFVVAFMRDCLNVSASVLHDYEVRGPVIVTGRTVDGRTAPLQPDMLTTLREAALNLKRRA